MLSVAQKLDRVGDFTYVLGSFTIIIFYKVDGNLHKIDVLLLLIYDINSNTISLPHNPTYQEVRKKIN